MIILVTSNGKEWHYLEVKQIISIIKKDYIKNNGDFYFLICLHSFRTKSKLESHKRACENKDFFNVNMSSEDSKISEFN